MIRNQWYAVLDSKQVTKKPAGFIRMGERLAFWRDDAGKVVCMKDKCAHRGASLAIGRIVHNHIECPFHGLEYDNSGKCACIPANGVHASVPETSKLGLTQPMKHTALYLSGGVTTHRQTFLRLSFLMTWVIFPTQQHLTHGKRTIQGLSRTSLMQFIFLLFTTTQSVAAAKRLLMAQKLSG